MNFKRRERPTMLCRASAEMMSLRLDGMLGPQDVHRLEEHLSSCGECRAQYLLMREADSLLRVGARQPLAPPGDFALKVMQRVAITPVQRPGLWERERAQLQGGRPTLRLSPTGPITGGLVALPTAGIVAPSMQVAPPGGLRQILNALQSKWIKAYVGGLSVAGAMSVLIVALLAGMWFNGGLALPTALNQVAPSVTPNGVLASITTLVQQLQAVIAQINLWLVAALAA